MRSACCWGLLCRLCICLCCWRGCKSAHGVWPVHLCVCPTRPPGPDPSHVFLGPPWGPPAVLSARHEGTLSPAAPRLSHPCCP